eukprot:Phypoly_transcript_00557.p1 GENE.Phypoly_transcript_00557~~Phypoly_transcript_00557.p1  ORF type:complete len:806 (-),score=146.24 Phypoly_transcript_00557:205-2622(-)
MIKLVDLSTSQVIVLAHGSTILGRGVHGISDRHCSRKQAEINVDYNVTPPTIRITPLGMNPIRRETPLGMIVANRGEPMEYTDGSVFALFGDHKYQVRIGDNTSTSDVGVDKKSIVVIDLVDVEDDGGVKEQLNNDEHNNRGEQNGHTNNTNYNNIRTNNNNNNNNINNTNNNANNSNFDCKVDEILNTNGKRGSSSSLSASFESNSGFAPKAARIWHYSDFSMTPPYPHPPPASSQAPLPHHHFHSYSIPAHPHPHPYPHHPHYHPFVFYPTTTTTTTPYQQPPSPDVEEIRPPHLPPDKFNPIVYPLSYEPSLKNKQPIKPIQSEKPRKPPPARVPKYTTGKLVVIYHDKCLEHNVPEWHLETKDRLRVAIEIINELSKKYPDSTLHVVRNPSPDPPSTTTLKPSSSFLNPSSSFLNPSPYLSYEPLSPFPSEPSFLMSRTSLSELPQPPSIAHVPSTVDLNGASPANFDRDSSTNINGTSANGSSSTHIPLASSSPFPLPFLTPVHPVAKEPPFKLVSRKVLEACHNPEYLDDIMNKIPLDSQPLHATQYSQDDRDPDQGDTFISSGTWDAAVFAASVVCLAVDYIANENYLHSFCAVRPPGHHAGIKGKTQDACSQGYCILNNVAIGAVYAAQQYSTIFSRVAIVDFDVHHGNGTQEILGSRHGFLFISIHVGDLYPHTGGMGEKVHVSNHGRVVNISLHPNSGPKTFKKYFEEVVIPKLEEFAPQLIFLSSGFDGHKADPTEGGMRLTKAEYRHITELLKDVAMRYCGGRLISVLEGGYHLPSLKKCIEEHLLVLAEDNN